MDFVQTVPVTALTLTAPTMTDGCRIAVTFVRAAANVTVPLPPEGAVVEGATVVAPAVVDVPATVLVAVAVVVAG